MFDKELRKTIGSRTRQRRKELNLTQDYLAEKLDVNKSTIQRYESGTIDNTKKLVVEGLANALHVSQDWLTGKTDDFKTDISSKLSLQVLDEMKRVKKSFPLSVDNPGNEFAETMLLVMLKEFNSFSKSFEFAYEMYHNNTQYENIAETIGFSSNDEFNEVMFLREIMHTSNTFYELSDIVRDYAKNPELAVNKLKNLLEII